MNRTYNVNKPAATFLLLTAILMAAGCERSPSAVQGAASGAGDGRSAAKANASTAAGAAAPQGTAASAAQASASGIDPAIQDDIKRVTADLPFQMPAIKLPHFPDKDFKITDYGAVGDGIALNTDAINKAIQECSKAGGGTVVIPSGIWLSGPIELKSDVNLHLDSGAILLFSPDRSLFKKSLLSAPGLHNIAITGDGSINGNGEAWRPVKKMKVTEDQWKDLVASGGAVSNDVWAPTQELLTGGRPLLLDISYSTSVLIDGVHLENSPMFTANLSGDQDVVIRNTKVFNEYSAQNGDGLDLTSSKNVVMVGDTVNAGDDAITMKSSNGALENVVIADCTVYHGHGGFVVGSNTYGGVKNVYVNNCNYIGTDTGIRFKSYVGGGGTVENIYLNNIRMKDIVNDAITFSSLYKGENEASDNAQPGDYRVPLFKNIHISNVVAAGAEKAVTIEALPHIPLQDVELNHVVIQAGQGVTANYAQGITMNDVKIVPKKGPVFDVRNSSGWKLNHLEFPQGTDTFMQLEGKTAGIQIAGTDPSAAKTPFVYGDGVSKDAVSIQGK